MVAPKQQTLHIVLTADQIHQALRNQNDKKNKKRLRFFLLFLGLFLLAFFLTIHFRRHRHRHHHPSYQHSWQQKHTHPGFDVSALQGQIDSLALAVKQREQIIEGLNSALEDSQNQLKVILQETRRKNRQQSDSIIKGFQQQTRKLQVGLNQCQTRLQTALKMNKDQHQTYHLEISAMEKTRNELMGQINSLEQIVDHQRKEIAALKNELDTERKENYGDTFFRKFEKFSSKVRDRLNRAFRKS